MSDDPGPGQSSPAGIATTSTEINITPTTASSLSIMVPGKNGGGFFRLGTAAPADEGTLPQDPAQQTPTIAQGMATADSVTSVASTAGDGLSETVVTDTGESPFANGMLTYSTDGIQLVAPHGYIRIGIPSQYEDWLPHEEGQTYTTSGNAVGSESIGDGVAIFSRKGVHTIAPTANVSSDEFTRYSSDSLEVTGGKSSVVNATRTWGSSEDASSVSFSRIDTYAAQFGSAISTVTGNQVAQYLGNLVTAGIGWQMTSNYGFTQNVFGGQSVEIQNKNVEVKGWRDQAVGGPFAVASAGGVSLACSPLADVSMAAAAASVTTIAILTALGAAAGQMALDITMPALLLPKWGGLDTSRATMRGAMDQLATELLVLDGLALLAQALATVVGLLARTISAVSEDSPFGSITISEGEITMMCGLSILRITPEEIVMFGPEVNVAGGVVNINQTTFLL